MASQIQKTSAAPHQNVAGGGVTADQVQVAFKVDRFTPMVEDKLKKIHAALKDGSSLNSFLDNFHSGKASALEPLPQQDLSLPMARYFISSSHNTYLTGNQLSSVSSTDPYKNVLLRGCRCVEIDVWDGDVDSDSSSDEGKPAPVPSSSNRLPSKWTPERAEPRVLHGYTATKEISFRSVCEAIGRYAFVSSDLPIIVSLEVHTSLAQQEIMVEIMKQAWGDLLLTSELAWESIRKQGGKVEGNPKEPPTPSPENLRKKILVKVKYTPPKPPAQDKGEPADSPEENDVPEQKSKILESLSQLGIYMKSHSFKGLDKPEAKVPAHIFSLSERRLVEVHQDDPKALLDHNKHYLMRTYPHGLRVSSSNLHPEIYWRKGVQIVALNWQKCDEGMMLNEAMFAGTGGWIPKPAAYRSNTDIPLQHRGTLNLSIEFLAGQDIPLPPDEDDHKSLTPYIKVELHAGSAEERARHIPSARKRNEADDELKRKTKTGKGKGHNGQDPDFESQVVAFKAIEGVEEEMAFVRFKVMDKDTFSKDDLAAWACFRLDRLRQGYRFIHLFDRSGVQTKGVILVNIKKEFTPYGKGAVSELASKVKDKLGV